MASMAVKSVYFSIQCYIIITYNRDCSGKVRMQQLPTMFYRTERAALLFLFTFLTICFY